MKMKFVRKYIQAVLMLLVLGFVFSSLNVAYVSAEPAGVTIKVYILKHVIDDDAPDDPGAPFDLPPADIKVKLYYQTPDGTWHYAGRTAIVGDSNDYTYDPPRTPGWFDWPYTKTTIPIRIEVWDDDAFDGDDIMDVSPKGDEVDIEYDIVTGTWVGDTSNHVCGGDEGEIYFSILPHWTKLSLEVALIEVDAHVRIKLSGYLDATWPGLTNGLVNNILDLTDKYNNREIELWDWNVDTGETILIDKVRTASDGSYQSREYSFTSIGLHEIQAIFRGDGDFAKNFARAKICVGRTVETTDSTLVEDLEYAWYRTVNAFRPEDNMYVKGCGYPPCETYDLYVVEDTEWSDGMGIPDRIEGTETEVNTDVEGSIVLGEAWVAPLILGTYDIVIDINGNGVYDEGIDALDDNDIRVTAGFLVIPEYLIGTILGLAGCFAAFGVFRISKRKHPIKLSLFRSTLQFLIVSFGFR